MSDGESVKKMLRSVLQSSKGGVSVGRLQSEYRSLCGELIPLKQLGYPNLEEYLRTIPSVVRMEYRMGELTCFAAVCKETAHIAELVARQKSSKKPGRSQLVNCRMRAKPSNPHMFSVMPRSSLRQPSAGGSSGWLAGRLRPYIGYGGSSAAGDYRQLDQRLSCLIPIQHRGSSSIYDPEQVQSKLPQLLAKHCSGLWLSKLPEIYEDMFSQPLHPQALIDLEKWTHICSVEEPGSTNRADRLVYPPLPPKPSTAPTPNKPANATPSSPVPSPNQPSALLTPSPTPKPTVSPKSPLAKPTFLFPPQPVGVSSVTLRSPAPNPASALTPRPSSVVMARGLPLSGKPRSPIEGPVSGPSSTRVGPIGGHKVCRSAPTSPVNHGPNPKLNPQLPSPTWNHLAATPALSPVASPAPSSGTAAVAVSPDVHQKLKELLSKYSHGLWVHALPKLFTDTFKTTFPEHVLGNLSLLLDLCTVEYPVPDDKTKAILYNSSISDMCTTNGQEGQPCSSPPPPSGLEVVSSVAPPPLVLPTEQYPSVLVTEAKNSNTVTVRYVGESFSEAQEAMEDSMRSFYTQNSTHKPLSRPAIGQLAAVRGDEGDELARAQVLEIMTSNRVKVYYVDYGFSVEISRTNLVDLHQDFLTLPFQAINVKLAGLEFCSSHPTVLSSLDSSAVGKILLMEMVEPCRRGETPLVVLYDTSQDDDVNINAACVKALRDKTMDNPLTVNSTYQNICVTNVCSDGTIYCQLPSRGAMKLNELLNKVEAFFSSQVTSESLVSRLFSGKFCLARYKGRWSRVEITNLHGSRVMDIVFTDVGVTASVEVTELREIPPPFLNDLTIIPPQAIKCCLADLTVPSGEWNSEALVWLREAVLNTDHCSMKISKLDQNKQDRLVHIYLFSGSDSQQLDHSLNHQLAQSHLLQRLPDQNNNTIAMATRSLDAGDISELVGKLSLDSPALTLTATPALSPSAQAQHRGAGDSPDTPAPAKTAAAGQKPLPMPPLVELPQPGQNMDVFVPVACHPGHFVVQPWQDLYKLVVLMGEMVLYYHQTQDATTSTHIQKGEIYAAKVDKSWHRVLVKAVLTNGLVSVYELDYGKYELVNSTQLQPLIEEFRQLPFQAITAQLAGLEQGQWSEEASMVFRNHVEKRALVAQVESVQEVSQTGSEVRGEIRERRLTVYLVDTSDEKDDVWIHDIMVDVASKLSAAA
ncbi:tudor domain-containing protein 7A [Polymixia lowei]